MISSYAASAWMLRANRYCCPSSGLSSSFSQLYIWVHTKCKRFAFTSKPIIRSKIFPGFVYQKIHALFVSQFVLFFFRAGTANDGISIQFVAVFIKRFCPNRASTDYFNRRELNFDGMSRDFMECDG
jgi:hypothetical protein